MIKNVFEELVKRGLVKQATDANKVSKLLKHLTTFYIGFDPTADSLHVGHLLQLVTAKRLIDAGHKAILLIGSATALIGDPTGKIEIRKMLSVDDVRNNAIKIHRQFERIVQSDNFKVVDNSSWFMTTNFLTFISNVGAHFSVNNMLRAECFKSRMESGLSFLEFNYMVMQAFDFFRLNQDCNCLLQIGGDDQWSNILAGTDLIHKKTGKDAFGLTLPLLVNSDGTKMGKTERGAVWLDPEKTSPFDFFQFWRNIPDDKVRDCINFFTFSDVMESQPSDFNETKKLLAFDITALVHGQKAATQACEQAEALFEKHDASAANIVKVAEGSNVLDVIIKCGFAKSRTEARNLMLNKGITINEEVQIDHTLTFSKVAFGNELVLKKGKKNFCRLVMEDQNV